MIYASSAPADDLEQSDSATDLAVQIAPLLPSSTSELAPPIILVPPSIARPRRLLDIPVAVDRVPFLGVVRQSQTVLGALAVDKVAEGWPSITKLYPLVVLMLMSAGFVPAQSPTLLPALSTMLNTHFDVGFAISSPLLAGIIGQTVLSIEKRRGVCLLSNAICASHPSCCSGGSSSSSLGTSTASGVPNRASKYFHVAYIA